MYSRHFKENLDYIFHNNKLRVLSLLELPKEDSINPEEGCPSLIYPSDHFRIESVFEVLEEGD